jgi:hypothetical protein
MEARCDFFHNPQDGIFHSHRRENLISCTIFFFNIKAEE